MTLRHALLGSALVAAAAVQTGGGASLFPNLVHDVGDVPAEAVGGDFNGDGHLDVAVTHLYPPEARVLLGRGDATFDPAIRFATGRDSTEIVSADFNGDGRADLAVVNEAGHDGDHPDLSVLLGNGDGTFQDERVTSVAAYAVSRLGVGDFNEDGVVDLAVPEVSSRSVAILIGNGDGTFTPGAHPGVGDEPSTAAVADLDHDGHQDLVIGNAHENNVSTLRGRGDGTFEAQRKSFADGQFRHMELADFDHDGEIDLAATYGGSSRAVGVYRGRGDGTFAPGTFYFLATRALSLFLDDVNGDGFMDLLVMSGNEFLSVLIGQPGGKFAGEIRQGVGSGPTGLVPGRFDADTREDVAVLLVGTEIDTRSLVALPGNGDGTYGPTERVLAAGRPAGLTVGDFDADGRLDVATANSATDVSVLSGLGDGRLGPERRYGVGIFPSAITTTDFNEDGRADLAVASDPGQFGGPPSGTLSILFGRGDGTFPPDLRQTIGGRPAEIIAADLDSDGHQDLVIADADFNTGGELCILYGRGDGSFRPPVRVPAGVIPVSVVAARLDGDTHLDLAVAAAGDSNRGQPGAVLLLAGHGDGTFSPGVVLAGGVRPVGVAAGDLDGDGVTDLVFSDQGNFFFFPPPYDPGRVAWLRGHGDGTFDPMVTLQAEFNPGQVGIGDVDGNGLRDVVAKNLSFDLSVFPGLGNGQFPPRQRFAPAGQAMAFALADLNGDGRDDLVSTVRDGVSILLSRASATDADGDGVPDSTDTCRWIASADQANADGDAVGDVCDRCARDPRDDADRDGVCGDADVCPDVPDPAQADFDHDGRGDLCDNCMAIYNPGQEDADADGDADACDNCPAAPNPDQVDTDGDEVGDACDLCVAVTDAAQSDTDGDRVGDACDDCVTATNPGQEDANHDGSGDACQPTIGILGLEHRVDQSIVVPIQVGDPQGDVLRGRLDITPLTPIALSFPETLDASDCALAYLPGGAFGEGIGYLNAGVGEPVLFDLDSQIGCVDLVADYRLAPGPCVAVTAPFVEVLPLSGLTLPAAICARPAAAGAADVDIVVLDATPDHVVLSALSHAPVFTLESPTGVPHRVDISGLPAGGEYELKLTVTDGSTVPVSDAASFGSEGETTLVIGQLPVAIAGVPPPAECDRPGAGATSLDGRDSHDRDPDGAIVSYEWYANPGTPEETQIAEGITPTALLPLGTTPMALKVTDDDGMVGWAESSATVVDTAPPLLALTADPALLWPPNHSLHPVELRWTVSDLCDPAPIMQLVGVHSSEADDTPGNSDGDTITDIVGAGSGAAPDSILLRAERDGTGQGRIYEVVGRATDSSGNSIPGIGVVTVPHDLGSGPDPLILHVVPDPEATRVQLVWAGLPDAVGYDLIRGRLSEIRLENHQVMLGAVEVLVRSSMTLAHTEEGDSLPAPGEGFFYLVAPRNEQGNLGYGSESVPWPRVPSSCAGGCPY